MKQQHTKEVFMTLKETLNTALLDATRSKNRERLTVIRGILAEITVEEKKHNVGTVLSEDTILTVILREKKKFEEMKTFAEQGGRTDLRDKALEAVQVIDEFLPETMSENDVIALIEESILAEKASSIKDMGKIMKRLTPSVRGKFDTKRASEIVREILGGSK
jgi:hypothetical protein